MLKSLTNRGQRPGELGLAAYLLIDLAVVVTAVALPDRDSWFVVIALTALSALGAGALGLGIWRQRAEPRLAWWFLFAGAALYAGVLAAGIIVTLGTGQLAGWVPGVLAVATYPPFIVG